jgi:hypothetical protein
VPLKIFQASEKSCPNRQFAPKSALSGLATVRAETFWKTNEMFQSNPIKSQTFIKVF